MKKMMITILTCSIVLLCVGLSYSYFTGSVNGEDKELLVSSKNVRILFTDSREIANNEIEPGWSESKTFSVKNESNGSFNYNIVFENLVNTFVTEGFLQYKITSTNGYNMEGYLDIPKSSTPIDVVLAYDIDLPVDTTHEYTIEFIYHDSNTVDQSEDMGKIFEGNLAIVEGTVDPSIKYTVTMNSDNGTINPTSNKIVKKGNLEFEVTPNVGYDINSMSVSCDPVANTVITDNIIRVNDIRQDHNCEVSFDKETYTVNIVVNNGESDALNKLIEYGGSGTATITPNKGYTLENATVNGNGCSLSGDILSISNVQSNGTCTVTLPREKYKVTLTGTGISNSTSPQEAEYEGETTIDFTLSKGYELGENVVNCDNGEPSISGNTLTVSNVTDNTICTLSPVLKSYDVTLKVVGGTPESETKIVTHNGSTTYTIANDTGYKLELNESISCTGNASGSLSGSTVTISGVTTTQDCTVKLKKQTYTVSVSVNDSTMGIVSPANSTVNHGDNLSITIHPAAYYKYSSNDCGLTVTNNKMTFTNITSSKSCKVIFVTDNTLSSTIKRTNPPKSGRTDFTKIDNGTPGLYTEEDDQGTTYYFSGDGTNMKNWVSFAGKMWRVIRINGNGSARLLYAGSGNTDGYIGSRQPYNSTDNNPAYVGWKYTANGSLAGNRENSTTSNVFNTVSNWYKTNITNKGLANYIDIEAIYCNDRELASGSKYSTSEAFHYAGNSRLVSEKSPTFNCSNTSDSFKDGFGLMTADEIAFAGGVFGEDNGSAYYYLNANGGSSTGSESWWTMTPSQHVLYVTNETRAFVFYIGVSDTVFGNFSWSNVSSTIGVVRPVVSLKSNVLVTGGDGSGALPYTLTLP